ncbi:flagellar hook-associated protein FlgK [Roseovarius salinarum]|uniref:flagellar hook-associated protein FlgK n=1 Tax=Roseovarius salinarum TaxID=1981892 RepID=UPI0012FFECC0|nr:flagellar hook-associated protein FlgK [Roseovarius salinarum]
MQNALSGLKSNGRAADVVSANLANMRTEGYGRRQLELTTMREGTSGGVRVLGVRRHVDAALIGDRRLADSTLAAAETRSGLFRDLDRVIGSPDEPASLSARVAALEDSLVSAGSRPDLAERLDRVRLRAVELAGKIREISDKVQAARMDADRAIGTAVESINRDLQQVEDLNATIMSAKRNGREAASLMDQRQKVIDRIAVHVPVHTIQRDAGAVALMTPGGTQLVDGPAARLGFSPTGVITAHMTQAGGHLSRLTVNGVAAGTEGERSAMGGGKLGALFERRDVSAVQAQEHVDAVARDLIERFQSAGLDPSRAAGAPGLFTDRGAAFDPADETGIAGRIEVNSAIDPARGGALWKIRDGLGAAAPGSPGDAALLHGYSDALSADRPLGIAGLGAEPRTASGHAGALASWAGQRVVHSEQALSHARGTQSGLAEAELQDGVDTDAEMQRLMLIERAYGANARMVQTIDEMMQTLLRI